MIPARKRTWFREERSDANPGWLVKFITLVWPCPSEIVPKQKQIPMAKRTGARSEKAVIKAKREPAKNEMVQVQPEQSPDAPRSPEEQIKSDPDESTLGCLPEHSGLSLHQQGAGNGFNCREETPLRQSFQN